MMLSVCSIGLMIGDCKHFYRKRKPCIAAGRPEKVV